MKTHITGYYDFENSFCFGKDAQNEFCHAEFSETIAIFCN